MNSFSALSDPNEPVDPTDVEFFKFSSLVPDAKVSVQNEPFDIAKYPATVSLMACSSKFGNLAVVTVHGFTLSSTKALRTTIYAAEKGATVPFSQDKISIAVSKPIRQLRFTATEEQIVLAVEGGELFVYNVKDIETQKENATPANHFTLSQEIIDLRPNPEEFPNLAAVLLSDNHCKIIDITNGSTTCELPIDDATAICWSPKGKQIVCGKLDGSLQHFDKNGARKDVLPIPQAMSDGNGEETENRRVQDVLWIENHIFLVLYARQPESEDDPFLNDGYIIDRKPKTGTEPLYIKLAEITPIFTTEGRGNHFYMETICGLGKEIKHLVVIANAATNEISVVGEDDRGEWAVWQLPENGIASFPLSEETFMDTYPLGLCLDFSAGEKLPPFDSSDSEKGVEPVPIFYYINDEGLIGSYHCYNVELARRGESYKTTETKPAAVTSQPAENNPSGFSAFGDAATSNNSFGDLLSGKATPPPTTQSSGFGGFGSFGGSGGIPSFSNLGAAANISTPSGFGFAKNTSTPAASPAFGSTSGFGSGSTFGSTNFKTDKPLASFGGGITNTTTASTSSFGSTSATTGSLFPKSSFGTSGFGSAPTTQATETKTETKPVTSAPAFGSTSTMGGGLFASAAKNVVPGAKTPTPAFGTTSGFGSSTQPVTNNATTTNEKTENKPATSAFGSTSTMGGGLFASAAKNTVPGATAPKTTFGTTSGFGSTSSTSTTSDVNKTETKPATSAFGSTSTMGGGLFASAASKSTFGTTSGFGSALSNNTKSDVNKTETKPATSAFGSTSTMGGGLFASAAKNTVPGATAPKTTFGTTSGFGSTSSTSTTSDVNKTKPAAPAFGSTSTMGSGLFASAAKNTVPGATAPKATFGFGSNEATPVASKPEVSKNTTPAVTPVSASVTPSVSSPSVTAKPVATTEPPKEKRITDEGMAKQFEDAYFTVSKDLDKLKEYYNKVSLMMKANTMSLEPKSEESLKNTELAWGLNEASQLGTVADNLALKIKQEQVAVKKMKEVVDTLFENFKKSMDKREDIEYLLGKEIDTSVVDILDNRELDAETKTTFDALQNKVDATEKWIEDMELKVQANNNRQKIKNEHNAGTLSLYSLHRSIRDIEREIISRNKEIKELEDRMFNVQLDGRKDKSKSEGFSCEDLSDTDDEESEHISRELIEHTTRYIRRYNFLDTVINETSKRGPLLASTSN